MAEAARRLLAETGVPPEGIRRFPGQGDPNTQLTDADPDAVTFDLPVELTFRRFHAGGGLVNYFRRFRPLLGG